MKPNKENISILCKIIDKCGSFDKNCNKSIYLKIDGNLEYFFLNDKGNDIAFLYNGSIAGYNIGYVSTNEKMFNNLVKNIVPFVKEYNKETLKTADTLNGLINELIDTVSEQA